MIFAGAVLIPLIVSFFFKKLFQLDNKYFILMLLSLTLTCSTIALAAKFGVF